MNSIIEKHFQILDYIKDKRPETQKEISKGTGIPKSTVNDVLKRFKKLSKVKKIDKNGNEIGFDKPGKYVLTDFTSLEESIKKELEEKLKNLDLPEKIKPIKPKTLSPLDIIFSEDEEYELGEIKKDVAFRVGRSPDNEKFNRYFYRNFKEIALRLLKSNFKWNSTSESYKRIRT